MHIWSSEGPRETELARDTYGLSEYQSRSLHGGSSLRSAEGRHSGAELVLADLRVRVYRGKSGALIGGLGD